ncbi:PAS domain-containing protein [Flavobacterium sp. 3HN19-14]|uniref:PAS domain-containing protein n=1 Tax=Flavobacterium sp. 3HN19-14 TaxID=3448133 RepID=UPI003EE27A02
MKGEQTNIEQLQQEIAELKNQLFESNAIIEAIREGSVDALVLNKEGNPHVYSLESADYTYRILIEKFSEGALSISDDGLILYCNDYFSKLIDIPADKIIGTFFNHYVDSHRDYQILKAALQYGRVKVKSYSTPTEKNCRFTFRLQTYTRMLPRLA